MAISCWFAICDLHGVLADKCMNTIQYTPGLDNNRVSSQEEVVFSHVRRRKTPTVVLSNCLIQFSLTSEPSPFWEAAKPFNVM